MEWQRIVRPTDTFMFHEHQHVGCGYDCWVGKKRVEGKNDMASKKWGNAFIELKQTFNSWRTWQFSGVSLSLIKDAKHWCDIFVMALYEKVGKDRWPTQSWFFWASPHEWKVWALTGETKRTGFEVNGNLPGSFAEGRVVPMNRLLTEKVEYELPSRL